MKADDQRLLPCGSHDDGSGLVCTMAHRVSKQDVRTLIAERDQARAEVARMVADRNEYMGYLTVARQERDEVKTAARALLDFDPSDLQEHASASAWRALEELL